jgi:hypothetical protein
MTSEPILTAYLKYAPYISEKLVGPGIEPGASVNVN